MNLAGLEGIDSQMIGTICQHLSEVGLIDWKPMQGNDGLIVGMARIRGQGVDVIEGTASPSINITVPNRKHALEGVSAEGVAGSFVQPSFTGVAAHGRAGVFVPDNQSWEVAAQIAARQRGLSAAALASNGTVVFPPTPEQSGQSTQESTQPSTEMRVDELLAIAPTQYPTDPATGIIVVQNFISINLGGEQFREFNANMGELLTELRRSNEISGEVREKLLAEMEAGMAILKSPKPDPKLVDLLLRRSLAYVADKAVGTIISTLAATALMALLKMTGLL